MVRKYIAIAALSGGMLAIPSSVSAADSDALLASFVCNDGEDKLVVTGGIEDNYAGGQEPANPRQSFADSPAISDYQAHHGNTALRSYDQGGDNNFWLETLPNPKPSNSIATRGMVILKFKPTGSLYSTDHLLIGDLKNHGETTGNGSPILTTGDYAHALSTSLPGGAWTLTNGMYHAELGSSATPGVGLWTRDGVTPLLDMVNNNGMNEIDFMIQDDSNVDFVKLAMCVEKKGNGKGKGLLRRLLDLF